MPHEDNGNGANACDVQQMVFRKWKDQGNLEIQPAVHEKLVLCETRENMVASRKNHSTIVSVPPSISFANFEVGKLYVQRLRIINKSPSELRISIKPPTSVQLHVELCSKLVIVAGGDATVKLHFRPKEPLPLEDEVVIRVTKGQDLRIPISCYIERIVLNVIVNDSVARCEENGVYIGATLVGNTLRVPITFHSATGHAKFIIISDKGWSNFSIDANNISLHKAILHAEVLQDKDCKSIASSDCFSISPSYFTGGTIPAMVVFYPTAVGVHMVQFRVLSSTSIVRSLHLVADAVMCNPNHIRLKADERNYDILTAEEDPSCDYYVNLGRTAPRGELTRIIRLENVSPVSYKYYWSVRPWRNCACPYDKSYEAHYETCYCEKIPTGAQSLSHHSVYAKSSRGILTPRSSVSVEVHLYCAGQMLGIQRSVLMLHLTEVPIDCVPAGRHIVKKKYVDVEAIPGLAQKRTRGVCDLVCAQLEVWWEVVPIAFVLHPPYLKMRFSRRVQSIPLTLTVTELHGLSGVRATWDAPVPVTPPNLVPAGTTTATVVVPLRDSGEGIDIRLKADDGSCTASTHIEFCGDPQYPSLSPAYVWAGVTSPSGSVTARLVLRNDTTRVIHWRTIIFDCTKDVVIRHKHSCSCGLQCPDCLINPHLGTLGVDEEVILNYKMKAPKTEGWRASLVQICTGDDDVCKGCAGLIAYRVLEPRLVLRVISDEGNIQDGGAVLRPPSPLAAGRSTDRRISVTNTTAVPTVLRWETAEDKDEPLHVQFSPNFAEVGAYASVEFTVTLVGREVCRRRIFVRQASVLHTSKPLYLHIDMAVTGIEVHIEIPIEGGTIQSIILTESPVEELPKDAYNRTQEALVEEFQNNGIVSAFEDGRRERCVQVIRKLGGSRSYCLEFVRVPVNSVCSKTLVLHNASCTDAAVVLSVRKWPLQRKTPKYPDKDQWVMHDSGVAVDCAPWRRVLCAGERGEVQVSVCSDTWGVYHDQLLVLVQNLEPLVIDLWMEVVGAPLKFITSHTSNLPPALWLASTDPERVLRATNYTHVDIHVYIFVVKEHAYGRVDSLTSCLHPDTGIELLLDADCGHQDSSYYRVEPEYVLVEKGQRFQWNVSAVENRSVVPLSMLVFRSTAVQCQGENWYRPPAPIQLVKLRSSARTPHLEVSDSEVTEEFCALDLCPTDTIRTQRTLEIKNTGNGCLTLLIKTKEPWRVTKIYKSTKCDAGIKGQEVQDLVEGFAIKMILQPYSSKEVLGELKLEAKYVIPEPGDQYASYLSTTTPLCFYDDENEEVLNIPLIMNVDRPVLIAEPTLIDFGLVSDGYAKKTYFTIRHTSWTRTIDLGVCVAGDENFKLHPEKLTLAPGKSQNVYVQYTCKWEHEHTARALVHVRAGDVPWCAVSVQTRAQPTRHVARAVVLDHSDFTVDTELLPPLW